MRPKLDLSVKDAYDRLFFVILAVDIVLRGIWLDKPAAHMFDEYYYVDAASAILGHKPRYFYKNAVLWLDPNWPHPQLAKLLIASSMYVFGDNPYGWRIPSVIFGSVAVLVFYLLMKRTANRSMVPLVATFLFSFENLIFVHSRIAMLDIFPLTLMLLGFYWYFSGHPNLSALGMALSSLTKLAGAAGFLVVIAVQVVRYATRRANRGWRESIIWLGKYAFTYAVSFVLIVTVLHHFWGGFNLFRQNLMSAYRVSDTTCPAIIASCPWQWLINQIQIPYFVKGGIVIQAAMNPAILFLTLPAVVYASWRYSKEKAEFPLFTVAWFLITYFPNYYIMFWHTTYIFYFLPTLPAVCAAVAYMFSDRRVPRLVIAVYLTIVLISFFWNFPFRTIP